MRLAALVALATLPHFAHAQKVTVHPTEPRLVALRARLDSVSAARPFDYGAYQKLTAGFRDAVQRLVQEDRLRTADDFLAASTLAADPIGFFEQRRVEHELALAALVLGHPDALRRLAFTWDGLNLSIGRGQRIGSYARDGVPTDMDLVPAPSVVRALFTDPAAARARAAGRADDPALQRMRDADQAERENAMALDAAGLARLRVADSTRREGVLAAIAAGTPTTGRDFHNAATVLQHGGPVDDFRLAHELALSAIALGDTTALWLVSRTYDRLLLHLGHRQRLATQFTGANVLRPIDTVATNDRIRSLLGGRTLASVRAGEHP